MSKIAIIVARVEDLPIPHVKSLIVKCSKCGKECWIEERYKNYVERGDVEVICTKCCGFKIVGGHGG